MCVYCLFFFKQKTAYEMRISDWSSDVCSSDLPAAPAGRPDRAVMVQRVQRSFGGGDDLYAMAFEQGAGTESGRLQRGVDDVVIMVGSVRPQPEDRKSTRLNSSH